MAATKAEVRNRAANELGILQLNGSLQSQDTTRIDNAYKEVYGRLRKLGLAIWAYAGSVPDELVEPVVLLTADNCLNTYGVADDRYARIKNAVGMNGDAAIKKITEVVASDYALPDDEPTDY